MSRSVLDVLVGPPHDPMRKRLANLGWFERAWAVLMLALASWLGLRSAMHWWQIAYVCWFGLSMPFVLGSANRTETGVGLHCRRCDKRSSDPGGDVTGYKCGYCDTEALERRCFDCGRSF